MPDTSLVSRLVAKQVMGKAIKTLVGLAGAKLVLRVLMPIKRWRLRKVPGSKYKPFVGDALEVAKLDFCGFASKLCREHSSSPICKIFLGSNPYVVVRDPKLGKEMLLKYDTVGNSQLVPWAPAEERKPWENVLLFLNGEQWSKCRKAVEETAHATALATHAAGMNKHTTRLIEVLDRYATENRPLNAQSAVAVLGHDIIIQAIFGTDMCSVGQAGKEAISVSMLLSSAVAASAAGGNASDGFLVAPEQIEDGWWDKYPLGSPKFGQMLASSTSSISTIMYTRLSWAMWMYVFAPSFLPLWRVLVRLLPDKNARLQLKLIRGIRQACLQLIRKWKAEHLTGNQANVASRPRGLMSYAFFNQDGWKYSENELAGMVVTSLFAGFDTTGTTLAMSLFFLAKNPGKQKKAQEEVDQVLGSKEAGIKDANHLHYISGVINETLRLCAPAHGTARRIGNQEYVHPGDAFRIPKNTAVWFPFYAYHRDPSIWPRAEEFLPERWVQPGHEDLAPTDPELFFPFGAGSRKCPGYKFALLENKVALARLLQRFNFTVAEGYTEPMLRAHIVRMPDHVMLKVSKRS